MSITTTESTARYTGDGSTVTFPFVFEGAPIPFFSAADIRVFLDGEIQSSGYSVVGNDIVFDVAPALDVDVFIRRFVEATQDKRYPTNDTFPSKSHEDALDRLTMIAQQTQRDIALSVRSSETSEPLNISLPAPVAGRSLKWNNAGDNLENSSGDVDAIAAIATAAAATATNQAGISTSAASTSTTQANRAEEEANRAEAAAGTVDGTRIQSPDALQSIVLANGVPAAFTVPNGITGIKGTHIRISASGTVTDTDDDQLVFTAPVPFTLHSAVHKTSAGTVEWTLKNGATPIVGGEDVEADDAFGTATFTADNAFAIGDPLFIKRAETDGAADLEIWLNVTWNTGG
jgi:hypothetical protein